MPIPNATSSGEARTEAGEFGQFDGGDRRRGVGECPIETELVAEMDHAGGDRTAQLREHREREVLQSIGIGGIGHPTTVGGQPLRISSGTDATVNACVRRVRDAPGRSVS